jgi:uncharacterized small protein (DUF1192 family)
MIPTFEEKLQEFIWDKVCFKGLEFSITSNSWENFMAILREAKRLKNEELKHQISLTAEFDDRIKILQDETEKLKKKLEIAVEALEEISFVTIQGLKMDAADGMMPLDWKYYANSALKQIGEIDL